MKTLADQVNSVPYTRLPSRLCEDEPQPTFHPQWGSSNSNDECLRVLVELIECSLHTVEYSAM